MNNMEPDTEYKKYYLASILLRGSSYEAELNEHILGALHNSPAASKIVSPKILPGTPNRRYFIGKFLSDLAHIPFAVKIVTQEQKLGQLIDDYEDGRPDPANPAGTLRAMSLDIRMELSGKKEATLYFREFAEEQLVCVSIAFDPSAINGGRWCKKINPQQKSDLPRFREFMFALIEAYPVLVGTLGLDIISVSTDLPHDEYRLDNGKFLHKFLSQARQEENEDNIDCIYINSSPWGFNKPFVYDCIEPHDTVQDSWAGRQYYDMHLVEEIRANAERAEKAFNQMYDSRYPKDDKDDALLFLSKAIGLATDLGLEKEVADLKSRYEHINQVFNSQFRR